MASKNNREVEKYYNKETESSYYLERFMHRPFFINYGLTNLANLYPNITVDDMKQKILELKELAKGNKKLESCVTSYKRIINNLEKK